MSPLAPTRTRAIPVPDAAHWASAGLDLLDLGIEPVATAGEAEAVVLASELPEALAEAVREMLLWAGETKPVRTVGVAAMPGQPTDELLTDDRGEMRAAHGDEGHGDDEHGGHGHEGHDDEGHDHDQMMEVTGEPSRDGLVMEEIETVLGPLSPALPTGLVVQLELDGDVVAAADVEPTIKSPRGAEPPDPLARAGWRWARARAAHGASLEPTAVARHLAATEVERALSHLMWLARFARLLGWLELANEAEAAARPLIATHRVMTVEGEDGRAQLPSPSSLEPVLVLLSGRRLGWRTGGLGRVTAAQCRERGLAGPSARASGLDDDLRAGDPAYQALGFEPLVREGGDAEARTSLRAEEALAALGLAAAALEAGELPPGDAPSIEGPRGPLSFAPDGEGSDAASTPGAGAARQLAGELAHGHELASALVVVASFDLSPWQVRG